jgi:hypothetical protein
VLDELNLYKKKVTDQEIHLDNLNSLIQMAGIDFNYDDEDERDDGEEESYLDSNSYGGDGDEWDENEDDLSAIRRGKASSSFSPRQGETYIPFTPPPLNSIRKVFQHVTESEGEFDEAENDDDISDHHKASSSISSSRSRSPSHSTSLASLPLPPSRGQQQQHQSPTRPTSFTPLVSLSPLQNRIDQTIALNETKYFLFKNSLQKMTLFLSFYKTDSHTALQQTQLLLRFLSQKYSEIVSSNHQKATQLSSDEEVKEYYQKLIKEYYEKEYSFQETLGDYRQRLELSSHEVTDLIILETNSQLKYQEMEQVNGHLTLKYQKLWIEYEDKMREVEEMIRVKEELEEELERRNEENLDVMNERDLLEQRLVVMRSERDELVRQFIPGGYYEMDEYGVEVLSVRRRY